MENIELTQDEYFGSLYNDTMKGLENSIKIAESNPTQMPYLVHSIECENTTLAMIELYYNKRLTEGRKRFYKATLAREWFFAEFPNDVSIFTFESMYSAVLSGNKEQAVHLAELYERAKADPEYLPTILLENILRYTILDDKPKVLEYAEKLEANKDKRGMKQYAEGHARVFRGILEHDEAEINRGLEFMLRHHAARMRRNGKYLEEYFAYDSVALAMLAKDRGEAITVKHDLLPMEYLEKTDIDYSNLQLFSLD